MQRLDRFGRALVDAVLERRIVLRTGPEHRHDQGRMVRGERTAALGHDDRLGHALRSTDLVHREHHGVRVLLQAVVDARIFLEMVSIVVDAQTAAEVEIPDARAAPHEFRVDAGHFLRGLLEDVDVGDLAADVAMQEHQPIGKPARLQFAQHRQQLGDAQAEFRVRTRRLRPSGRNPVSQAAREHPAAVRNRR